MKTPTHKLTRGAFFSWCCLSFTLLSKWSNMWRFCCKFCLCHDVICQGVMSSIYKAKVPVLSWWSVQLLPAPSPPISPPPPPFSSPSLCFFSPRMSELNQFYFLTLHPQLSHSYSLLLYSWLHDFFLPYIPHHIFHDNSITFSGLLPAHFILWARHPLQVALSPQSISNTLCTALYICNIASSQLLLPQ